MRGRVDVWYIRNKQINVCDILMHHTPYMDGTHSHSEMCFVMHFIGIFVPGTLGSCFDTFAVFAFKYAHCGL